MKRRLFIGAASMLGALRPRYMYAAQLAASHGEIYRQLGIRPLINAAGTYTTLTGSVMPDRVREAMDQASRSFVPLIDLQRVVGARLAKMLEVEGAMVTSGATGSIELATAACVTMGDPEKIRRVPDTRGMKNEVIVPKAKFESGNVVAGGLDQDLMFSATWKGVYDSVTTSIFQVTRDATPVGP